jgi:MarR family transcriptional regulator, lower aerobic nicotinate degradation pathway regulator
MDVLSPQSTPDPLRADGLLRLIYWTNAAGRQLRRCLGTLAEQAGLSDSELFTIWLCLGEEGGMVQGALATALGVSPAQMSGIVERLRQRGLIEMHRQTLDRRRQVWRGTAAGRQTLQTLTTPLATLAGSLAAQVSLTDQQMSQALCERLASAAEAWPDGAHDQTSDSTNLPNDETTRKAA